jgi:hypothetical protein
MKIGFSDVDVGDTKTDTPERLRHSYDGTWLGRSCGARWSANPNVINKMGILVVPGAQGVDFSDAFHENKILHTKNGTITINSIKQYAPKPLI